MTLSLATPLGYRSNGEPIWLLAGASEDPAGADGGDPAGGDGQGDGDADADGLTAGGRAALEAERAAAKKAKTDLRPWRVLARELGVNSPDELRQRIADLSAPPKDKSTEQPVDVERVRREAEAAVMAKATERIVRAEVKALAARTFADPEDAALLLSGSFGDLVDHDGEPDGDAISAALKDLLRRKPHLGARQEKTPPDYDGGSRRRHEEPQTMGAVLRSEIDRVRGRART